MSLKKRITVIQDLRINGDQVYKIPRKKRSTSTMLSSSVLILGEEPVFSEDELERTLCFFPPTPPKKNIDAQCKFGISQIKNNYVHAGVQCTSGLPSPIKKRCLDAGVQCEILTDQKMLFRLINQCSTIQPENAGDFAEIVKCCQKFTENLSFEKFNMDALSDISNSSKMTKDAPVISNEFLPSSAGKTSVKRLSHINKDLTINGSASCKKKGKYSLRKCKSVAETGGNGLVKGKVQETETSTKRRRGRPKKARNEEKQQIKINPLPLSENVQLSSKKSNDEDGTFKKPFDIEPDGTFKRPFDIEPALPLSKNAQLPLKKSNDEDTTFKKPFELDPENVFKRLPAKVVRALARNYLNPKKTLHKSLCLDETQNKELGLHFVSLQLKTRRLYSPSQCRPSLPVYDK